MLTFPVEVPPRVIAPEPLASSVIASFACPAEEVAVKAIPPPAAADLMFNPVTEVPVEASMLRAGVVAPFCPTARALAEEEVMV